MTSQKNLKATSVNTLQKRNSIRIGLVGCVSCGKSTLLNSICVNQYEEMKKCRTTMLPSVYMETNKTTYNNKDEKQKILEMNKTNNQNIFSGGVKLSNENCKAVHNMIPKIKDFTDLPQNIYLDIYDIPGLNDAETKDIYYKWIEDNFSELDIIIHIIDINSPLNTSDQIDILKMLIKNIHDEKTKNGRDVMLLTLVNKCDEMDSVGDGQFEMDDEDQENYDGIIKTTYEKIKEVTGEEYDEKFFVTSPGQRHRDRSKARRSGKMKKDLIHCEFSPISAADTFVYRMLHNDPEVKMDMKLLQKFGVNEVGRRTWNKMDEKEKREMISEHFSNADIRETLEITGYNSFTSIMNSYLTKEKQSNILINRIKQELSNEELINKNISTDKEELKKLIEIYNSYCAKVLVIDKLYKTDNSGIVTDLINQHIYRWINQISDISNESEGSVKRLQEYKDIISELDTNIDAYALTQKVFQPKIEESKKKRWSDSFGFAAPITIQNLSVKSTLAYLFGGYSKLQNEFFIKKLEDKATYETEFPKKVFENIDALRENACDSVESTIDDVLKVINGWLSIGNWSVNEKTPMSGYYEVDKENTTVKFCQRLIESYNYPKEKVIVFLKNYMLNRYTLDLKSLANTSALALSVSPGRRRTEPNMIKSYQFLLDTWLSDWIADGKRPWFNNLYIISKSYHYHSVNLDPTIDYYYHKDSILAIPNYLGSLIISCEEVEEDSEEYSSADDADPSEERDTCGAKRNL